MPRMLELTREAVQGAERVLEVGAGVGSSPRCWVELLATLQAALEAHGLESSRVELISGVIPVGYVDGEGR
jgi:hypothetical protein